MMGMGEGLPFPSNRQLELQLGQQGGQSWGGGSSSGCRDLAAVPVRRSGQWAPSGLLSRCFPSSVRNVMLPQNLSPAQASQGEAVSGIVRFTPVCTHVLIQQIFAELRLEAQPCSRYQSYRCDKNS